VAHDAGGEVLVIYGVGVDELVGLDEDDGDVDRGIQVVIEPPAKGHVHSRSPLAAEPEEFSAFVEAEDFVRRGEDELANVGHGLRS